MKTKEELKKYHAEWFQKNKQKVYEKHREYRQKNKQKIYEQRAEYFKQWREKNKEKWNRYSAEWYANNSERHAITGKKWDERNPGKRREIAKLWKERNKEKAALEQRERLLKYKTLVVEAYGGCCACCGEKHIGVLTVEHINRNGKQHRREIGGNLYYQLIKQNFPKDAGLSILCMNCNWIERHGNPCHHKTEKLNLTSAALAKDS